MCFFYSCAVKIDRFLWFQFVLFADKHKAPLLQRMQHVPARHCKVMSTGVYLTAAFACRNRGVGLTVPDELSHNACKQCRPAPCHHVPDAGRHPEKYIAARCMNSYSMSHCSSAAGTSRPLTTGNSWREKQRDKGCNGVRKYLGSIPSRRQASTDRGLVGSRLGALGSETKTSHNQVAG